MLILLAYRNFEIRVGYLCEFIGNILMGGDNTQPVR